MKTKTRPPFACAGRLGVRSGAPAGCVLRDSQGSVLWPIIKIVIVIITIIIVCTCTSMIVMMRSATSPPFRPRRGEGGGCGAQNRVFKKDYDFKIIVFLKQLV